VTAVYLQVAHVPQVQYLLILLSLGMGALGVLVAALWLARHVERDLEQLHDEDTPLPSTRAVVVPFRRRVH
jgi:hypothetical protein